MAISSHSPRLCLASGMDMTSYPDAQARGADGKAPCPRCGKPVKLTWDGRTRRLTHIPRHARGERNAIVT